MKREHIFRLRLDDAERDDLERRATEGGIAKADVIRKAMGWEPDDLIRRSAVPAVPKKNRAAPTTTAGPAADDGPGARGLSALARRIAANRP